MRSTSAASARMSNEPEQRGLLRLVDQQASPSAPEALRLKVYPMTTVDDRTRRVNKNNAALPASYLPQSVPRSATHSKIANVHRCALILIQQTPGATGCAVEFILGPARSAQCSQSRSGAAPPAPDVEDNRYKAARHHGHSR